MVFHMVRLSEVEGGGWRDGGGYRNLGKGL